MDHVASCQSRMACNHDAGDHGVAQINKARKHTVLVCAACSLALPIQHSDLSLLIRLTSSNPVYGKSLDALSIGGRCSFLPAAATQSTDGYPAS
jgi:hypothetical protein